MKHPLCTVPWTATWIGCLALYLRMHGSLWLLRESRKGRTSNNERPGWMEKGGASLPAAPTDIVQHMMEWVMMSPGCTPGWWVSDPGLLVAVLAVCLPTMGGGARPHTRTHSMHPTVDPKDDWKFLGHVLTLWWSQQAPVVPSSVLEPSYQPWLVHDPKNLFNALADTLAHLVHGGGEPPPQ